MDNGVEKRAQEQGVEGEGRGCGMGGESRGVGQAPWFQFPPIGDEFLSHSQANAQVSMPTRFRFRNHCT